MLISKNTTIAMNEEVYTMIITHTISITLNNDWTAPEKQQTIKEVNSIPENVLMSCRYDAFTNTTVCSAIWSEEKEEG